MRRPPCARKQDECIDFHLRDVTALVAREGYGLRPYFRDDKCLRRTSLQIASTERLESTLTRRHRTCNGKAQGGMAGRRARL